MKTKLDSGITCPNNDCAWHNPLNIPKGSKWYRNHGTYPSGQHGKVPRYKCACCNRTFSLRTLDKEYYLHYDDVDISQIFTAWQSGKSLCEIARNNNITVGMVRTRLKRCNLSA